MQTGSEKGLPKKRGWIGDENATVEEMIKIVKEKIIEPN